MQEFTLAVLVGAVQGLNQDLHRMQDLLPESIGDLVLVFERTVEQRRQSLVVGPEMATHAQQGSKGLQGDRLLPPESRVPRGVTGHTVPGDVNQRPALPVGDEACADTGGPAKHGRSFEG